MSAAARQFSSQPVNAAAYSARRRSALPSVDAGEKVLSAMQHVLGNQAAQRVHAQGARNGAFEEPPYVQGPELCDQSSEAENDKFVAEESRQPTERMDSAQEGAPLTVPARRIGSSRLARTADSEMRLENEQEQHTEEDKEDSETESTETDVRFEKLLAPPPGESIPKLDPLHGLAQGHQPDSFGPLQMADLSSHLDTELRLGGAKSAGLSAIVPDKAVAQSFSQMPRSQFLGAVESSVRRVVDEGLSAAGRTSEDCPYLGFWFGYYRDKDIAYLRRAIVKYAPESAFAESAEEVIAAIVARARRGVEAWLAARGSLPGVTQAIRGEPVDANAIQLAQVGMGPGELGTDPNLGALNRGLADANDPRAILSRLDSGQPLEPAVRSGMEAAFGTDFSAVRVHADTDAGALSDGMSARAFTIGNEIAFAAGEYRPGSLAGDALLAHELAHVIQQSGATGGFSPTQTRDETTNSLEEDADLSAVGAVASIWAGARRGLSTIAQTAVPRLRSGLGLRRCSRTGRVVAGTLQPRDSLWFFCGESPSGFTTRVQLTAPSTDTSSAVTWAISQGGDKVEFEGDPRGAQVTVRSKGASTSLNDVRIEASGAAPPTNLSMTVREPHHLEAVGSPTDHPNCPPWNPCPHCPAYWTELQYRIKDNLGDTVESVEVNENFPGSKINDIPNNWVSPAAFSTRPFWTTDQTAAGTFVDNWYVSCGNPSPVAPTAPNAGVGVDRMAHEFYVGSQSPAHGCRVQTHTAHRYRGYARHEGITTPAPTR